MVEDRCCGSIATGYECQGIIFRSEGKLSRIKRQWKKHQILCWWLGVALFLSHICVCKSPRRICRRTEPSNVCSCVVAVRREGRIYCFIMFAHLHGISSDRTMFMPASVLKRHTHVCLTAAQISYYDRGSYVGLEVRVTPADVGANSRGLKLSPNFCLGLNLGDWLGG